MTALLVRAVDGVTALVFATVSPLLLVVVGVVAVLAAVALSRALWEGSGHVGKLVLVLVGSALLMALLAG